MANPRPKQLVEESLELFDKLQSSDDSPSKTFAAEGLIVAGGKIFRDKIKGVFVTAQLKDLIGNKKPPTWMRAMPSVVSLFAGVIFCVFRVIETFHLWKNRACNGIQELIKAILEIVSGVLPLIFFVLAENNRFQRENLVWVAAITLAIDAVLSAWDVINVLLSTSSSSAKTTVATLLKAKLLDLDDAVTKEDYTLANFREEVFAITFTRIGTQEEEEKAATDAHYIYEMVGKIFDEFFTDKFPTSAISDEMRKVGFSEPQIQSFNALARSNNRS